MAASVELTVQQLLQAHNYNTVGNLVRFYEEFQHSGEASLKTFYRQYHPPITPQHYTCVGLSLELLKRLETVEQKFPACAGKFYLVSCEEAIDNLPGYILSAPDVSTAEKEHVLVAMQLLICGRPGVLLLDPGYHVARVLTVMADHVYPHTGWFTQADEPHVRKDYHYLFSENTEYVQWLQRETRHGIEEPSESVIYISRPYQTPVDVTERRNLVYNFRSLLARNTKGHLIAGIYFPVTEKDMMCTIFYQNGNLKQRVRISLKESSRSVKEKEAIDLCCLQLELPVGELEYILSRVSAIANDVSFVQQLLEINDDINTVSFDN